MPHSRKQPGRHVLIAHLPQQLCRLGKLFIISPARVICPGKKPDGQFRLCHTPFRFAVRRAEQVQQCLIAVQRKAERAERICIVRIYHSRIAADPGIVPALIPERFLESGKDSIRQPLALVGCALFLCQHCPDTFSQFQPESSAGRAADKHAVRHIRIAFQITAHRQGTHAVTEQVQRQFRVLFPYPACHLVQIGHQRRTAVRIKVSQILRLTHTAAVATVIVYHARIAVICHLLQKRKIAFLMFAHPMSDLENRPWRFLLRQHQQSLEQQAVVVGFQCKFLYHSISSLVLPQSYACRNVPNQLILLVYPKNREMSIRICEMFMAASSKFKFVRRKMKYRRFSLQFRQRYAIIDTSHISR